MTILYIIDFTGNNITMAIFTNSKKKLGLYKILTATDSYATNF